MNLFSYIQKRLLLMGSAALLAILIFTLSYQAPTKKSRTAATTGSKVVATKKAGPKKIAPPLKSKPASLPGGCTLTATPLPKLPLAGETIPLTRNLSLSPDDGKLATYLTVAKEDKRPKFEQVGQYHLAGKIYALRAHYLAHYATSGEKPAITIPDGSDFAIPEERLKAKALSHDYATKAVKLLSACRPHPKYNLWSEALYLNAQALILLKKSDRAAHYLEIVGRTNSRALPANYARLVLARHWFDTGKYHDALKYLKKINELPSFHSKTKEFYMTAARMGITGEVTSLPQMAAPFSSDKETYRALMLVIAQKVIHHPELLIQLKEVLGHLTPTLRKPFLNWTWQLINRSKMHQRKALATAVCKLSAAIK